MPDLEIPQGRSVNWEIPQGEDYEFEVLWLQGESGSTPVNLTGCTAEMQFRRHLGGDVEFEPELTITALTGSIAGLIPRATTETLTGDYVGQLEVTLSGGLVKRLLNVAAKISGEATRE
jgi:hypothetical protein